MNQTVKITLATLMLSALTACSSGGSGSSDEPAANNTSSNTTTSSTSQPDTSTNNNTTTQPETSTSTGSQPNTSNSSNTESQPAPAKFSGYSFSYNGKVGKATNPSNAITISSDSIDTIVVNGKSYSIIPELAGISGNVIISTIWQQDDSKVVCCGTKTNIKSVKIGALLDNETVHTFVQGKATPEDQIPTTGRVVYEGEQTARLINLSTSDDKKGMQNSALSTHIDADFDNKNVSGYLYDGDKKFFDITDGKITGNNITNGKVSLTIQDEDNKQALNIENDSQFSAPLNAKFYGENAKEVAGTAHNEKWGVVFAASKSE
ncbi:transferrin-binding protein-like solute binding protein [Avibacterium volantium]|uniref:transferrin-binding protein-like solute binding protein n=1 Tax=Avibacterium TaxID=292486 RepID=UPI0039FBFF21